MVEEEEEKVEEVEERRHGAAGVQSIRGTRWETRAVPLFTIVTKKGHLHATLAPGRRRVTQGVWVNGQGWGGRGSAEGRLVFASGRLFLHLSSSP